MHAVEIQIIELFEATKDLKSFEEIKPHCDRFNEWIATNTKYSGGTLGSRLSEYGFYKRFKALPLEQGKNAELVEKFDCEGKVKGNELKHYVLVLCGLTKEEWNERNQTTRVINRLSNDQEVDPDKYLEVAGKLLESNNPHELAVGLIAVTGRRPHEILARAKFSPIDGESYHVMFEGQGKKRGEKPVFKIATLYPSEYVIRCLAKLRKEVSTKDLLREVANEFPNDLAKQNDSLDSRRGQSLRRVVAERFGDKYSESPALEVRNEDDQNNCKALRAAYGAIATDRDCARSPGARIVYFSGLMGHFVAENASDKDLRAITTTLGYSDYFLTKPVNFPPAPEKEKLSQVRISSEDYEIVKNLQTEWELPNQQAVVSRLINSHNQKLDVAKELLEAKNLIAKLNNQLQEKEMEATNLPIDMTNLEALIEAKINQAIALKFSQLEVSPQPQPEIKIAELIPQKIHQATQRRNLPDREVFEWEHKSHAELWKSKVSGAAEEKIRRSFEAICAYNDTIATGDNDRIAVTNSALRQLSGTNGLLVGDWIKNHVDEIVGHNSKYEMGNSKDSSKTETYYNKRHGKQKTEAILKTINEKLLDGEAIK